VISSNEGATATGACRDTRGRREVASTQYRAGGIQGDLLVGTSLIAAVVLWWTCWRGPWPAVLLSRASVGRSRVAG
jgi:hypothetical protein